MITTIFNVTKFLTVDTKLIPEVIVEYNKSMGGVDKFDQMIKYCSLKRKTNRWTQRFTVYILEILLHNSFVLYSDYFSFRKLSHYDFMEKVIHVMLERGGCTINIVENDDLACNLHLPIKADKRSDCHQCKINGIRSTTFSKCEKCKKFLCIDPCFYKFHVPTHDENETSECSSSDSD
jgi:Transposase IS4